MKVDAKIKNMPEKIVNSGFIVARRADDALLWYYGIYKTEEKALEVARELDNGIVLEMGGRGMTDALIDQIRAKDRKIAELAAENERLKAIPGKIRADIAERITDRIIDTERNEAYRIAIDTIDEYTEGDQDNEG